MLTISLGRKGINLFNTQKILFIIWLFLLVLPKGGIKIGGVPITWGYLILAMITLYALKSDRWKIRAPRIEALLSLVPFQIISAFTSYINNCNHLHVDGYLISFFVSFFFLPYLFLFLLANKIEEINLNSFLSLFKIGVMIITYYGIISFIHKHLSGKYFEIPLITSNLSDFGDLDDLKCNSRGLISKLISTYNNGQLFGISMAILLPLYCYVQKNRWHIFIAKLAVFLTISRTAWIGLLFNELFFNLFVTENRIKSILKLFLMLFLFFSGIFILFYFTGFGTYFLFDSNFGGRKAQFDLIKEISFFSNQPFAMPELTYVGVLYSFGLLGLITYLFALIGPLIIYSFKPSSKLRTCIILGLANHLFISLSDGAILYIPIMAFNWFFVSLLARKNLSISDETTFVSKNQSNHSLLNKMKVF